MVMAELRDILLVEDNPGDIEMTCLALRKCVPNCRVEVAHDGSEAMEVLSGERAGAETWQPQLILLDINLPRVNGKTFLSSLKVSERFQAIPVIMLTSSEAPEDVRDCFGLHAAGYVVKPFESRLYRSRVEGVVTYWSEISHLP
jgi:CheY-like chemotaxis protein